MIGLLTPDEIAVTNAVTLASTSNPQRVAYSTPPGFLGAWVTVEPGTFPTRLIITNADQHSASILYTWGDGAPDGTWLHAQADVLANGKLCCRFPGAITLTLSSDGQTLIGEREHGRRKASGSFRRVSRI